MNKDYGLEDICQCLDDIEVQLKKLVALEKRRQKKGVHTPDELVELDLI